MQTYEGPNFFQSALVEVASVDARSCGDAATRFPKIRNFLDSSDKSVLYRAPGTLFRGDLAMSDQSELVAISKLNGDFRRNYGKLLGAYLYLRSIAAARSRPYLLSGFLLAVATTCLAPLGEKADFLAAIRWLSQIHAKSST
jgi:hypothetical protein